MQTLQGPGVTREKADGPSHTLTEIYKPVRVRQSITDRRLKDPPPPNCCPKVIDTRAENRAQG